MFDYKCLRKRGFLMLENLAAAFVISVAVAGMLGLWAYGFKKTSDGHDTNTARELARAELERAKAFGYGNLPLGSADASGSYAVFRGSFVPASGSSKSGWAAGTSSFFDAAGNRTAVTSSNARYQVDSQITDTNIARGNTKPYGLGFTARRSVLVTVIRLPGGETVLTMGTEIVRGGL